MEMTVQGADPDLGPSSDRQSDLITPNTTCSGQNISQSFGAGPTSGPLTDVHSMLFAL